MTERRIAWILLIKLLRLNVSLILGRVSCSDTTREFRLAAHGHFKQARFQPIAAAQ